MKNITILVLLAMVVPAWAFGLGDLKKVKEVTDKKDDKEEQKECSSEKKSECKTAEPTRPMNKPEDVDKGGNIKAPYHSAKKGQMAKYKTIKDMATKDEVVEVKDRVVLIKSTTYRKGKPISKTLMYYPKYFKKPEKKQDDKKKPEVKTTDLPDETIKIGDRKIKCKVKKTEWKQKDGKAITTILWTSDKVPFGTVKMKSDSMGKMQVIRELIEFKK